MEKVKDCIFCKIVAGEIPSYKVYENKDILAFFTIGPVSEYHTLVIPKKHYENIYDLPVEEFKKIAEVIKKITNHYQNKLNIKEVNILNASGKNAQQSVPHFHVHIVPRKKDDGLNLWYETENPLKPDFQRLLNKIGKIE